MPSHTNPAEFLLDIVSSDFGGEKEVAQERVRRIQQAWTESTEAIAVDRQVSERVRSMEEKKDTVSAEDLKRPGPFTITAALLHRSWIKSYRDVVAYGIRILMYLGLAVMMGTVWLRLQPSQEYIQPFVNAIVSHLH